MYVVKMLKICNIRQVLNVTDVIGVAKFIGLMEGSACNFFESYE